MGRILGIDLGTSHCSLASINTQGQAELLSIPQLDGEDPIDSSYLLPSVAAEPAISVLLQ